MFVVKKFFDTSQEACYCLVMATNGRYTRAQVIGALAIAIGKRTQADFARENGLLKQEISSAMRGDKPSRAILDVLGFRRVMADFYEKAQ
jgi:hypothetical protein